MALISLLCRKKRIFVTTEHSAWNRRREKPWLFRPVEKLVYRCYDAITAVSKAAKSLWILGPGQDGGALLFIMASLCDVL